MFKLRATALPALRNLLGSLRARSDPFRMLAVGALILLGVTAAAPPGHSATSAWQPSETSTPPSGLDSAPTVDLQVASASGVIRPRAPSLMEAQAPSADFTLRPNQDGWPDTNPLLVQVTLTCPVGGPYCTYPLTFKFYSNDGGRFWLYDRPAEPDCGCAEVVEETGPYSLKSYTAFSYGVFVAAGTQRMLQWSVWAQPSPLSTMIIEATWNLTTPFVIAIEQMRIHPLVFIPGILGTMPPTYEATGAMDPILGSYEP